MKRLPTMIRALCSALIVSGVAACSQPTGLLNVATSPAEFRSLATLRNDAEITVAINDLLLSKEYSDLYFEVSTDVYEGRVLLTGTVKYEQNKQRVTELVRQVKGVHQIINELQVTDDYGPLSAANDLWIEAKLKALLLGAPNVRSIDYRWRSVRGTVYLIGVARSAEEIERVLTVIRNVPRVKHVVNHARVLTEAELRGET